MAARGLRILGWAAGLAAIGAGFTAFAPGALGGDATYIIVTGASMEPGLSDGDLVIARTSASYGIGDVVVYDHPDLGYVIHRIIGREGTRYILQGDNNSFVDGEQPTAPAIAGEQWIAVPGAGKWLARLQQPVLFGALVCAVALAVLWGGAEPARRKRNRHRYYGPAMEARR